MTRSKGFTLIELLVVVAIISIIASIGFVAYSGYVDSAKKKTAENAMMQLSLAQTEYYSENSVYYGIRIWNYMYSKHNNFRYS